ncbi:hypothetical protein [Brevibacillus thermoruber]|nr:hypothetical protein [Brevibacillus thermoruber]
MEALIADTLHVSPLEQQKLSDEDFLILAGQASWLMEFKAKAAKPK